MSRSSKLLWVVGTAVVLVVLAVVWTHSVKTPSTPAVTAKETPLYWYDPMHPSEHFDKPGNSPFMDMQLVPKLSDSPPGTSGTSRSDITIDARTVQSFGLRLATVERGDFARVINTVGIVGVDEHRIEAIQIRQPGWIERLGVRAIGDAVRRGQLLAAVYSPDLLATQQELTIAHDSGDPRLIEAAKQRLSLFGLPDSQIARIEKSGQAERRIDYFAPFDGYVMELGAREGAAIAPGTTLFQLADLASVWITAEVPESQATWIKAGDRVQAVAAALPGEHFEGHIDYVYPELTQETRTLKVRIVIQNPHRMLRPGMFATTRLNPTSLEQTLTVPSEAVINTGTRSVVIVAEDGNHFHATPVRVGAEQGGQSEILEGLNPGQRVVASGQFLLDSEANLRGAFDNLAGSNDAKPSDTSPMVMPMPQARPEDQGH